MDSLSLDLEFTGLHQNTTVISLALYNPKGKSFYAELTDYDKDQVDDWLQENVIDHLVLGKQNLGPDVECIQGTYEQVKLALQRYMSQFKQVRILGDCLAYDWVLLCEFWGGALNMPDNIYYIPTELCTLLEAADVDPDISRSEFSGLQGIRHNSLYDAQAAYLCATNVGWDE